MQEMSIIESLESEVRSYCRSFPTVFTRGKGCTLTDAGGKDYLDFLSGAGALNYGHNHPKLKKKLIEYLQNDGLTHSLDLATTAKAAFLKRFDSVILKPRHLTYKIQFPGPTGTNAVESALKLARKITGRHKVLSFTNAFHGMTLGSLSVSGNAFKREGAGIDLTHTLCMPYDGYLNDDFDSIEYIDRLLSDTGSGVDLPACAIVETIQAESGINVASFTWLQQLENLCREYEMLLIVDDVQVGCGRTGPFFSFEPAGIYPDIVCLSKSISGYGLPMALTLIKPEHDQWQPGEHNGTFRGHNLAFVTAAEALTFWESSDFGEEIREKGERAQQWLEGMVERHPAVCAATRGRGLIQGLECREAGAAEAICRVAFERGLIAETSGAENEVIKILPPLILKNEELERGLSIIEAAIKAVSGGHSASASKLAS